MLQNQPRPVSRQNRSAFKQTMENFEHNLHVYKCGNAKAKVDCKPPKKKKIFAEYGGVDFNQAYKLVLILKIEI